MEQTDPKPAYLDAAAAKGNCVGDTGLLYQGLQQFDAGACLFDNELRLVAFNNRFRDIFDFPEGMLEVGKQLAPMLHFLAAQGEYGEVDSDQYTKKVIAELRDMGEPLVYERHRADGRYYEARTTRLRDGYITIHTDITLRKQQEEALRLSEKKYRSLFEEAPVGIYQSTVEGQLIAVNDRLAHIFGYGSPAHMMQTDTSIGSRLSLSQEQREHLLSSAIEASSASEEEAGYVCREIECRRREGELFTAFAYIKAVRDLAGQVSHIEGFIEDVTERKQALEQIQRLAYYDTLTNLPNRRLLLDRLVHDLVQAKRFQRSLALMFLDLDNFKQVNDVLGHDVGDELLKVVAGRLVTCVRTGDTVSRQGGDEFVIILTEISHARDAALVAEKIISAFSDPVRIDEHRLHVTTSIGISVFPVAGTDDPREMMKKADIAMYEAKKAGRNGFHFYGPGQTGQ